MTVHVNLVVWILVKCLFAIIIARLLTNRAWGFMSRRKTLICFGIGIIFAVLGSYWFLTSLNHLLTAVNSPDSMDSTTIKRYVQTRNAGGNLIPLGVFFLMAGTRHLMLFRKR